MPCCWLGICGGACTVVIAWLASTPLVAFMPSWLLRLRARHEWHKGLKDIAEGKVSVIHEEDL